MPDDLSDLREGMREALQILAEETGLDAEALFGERVLDPADMTPVAAHAAGTIEGAGLAFGLTALELLGELRIRT